MLDVTTRRSFLQSVMALTASFPVLPTLLHAVEKPSRRPRSPNEKLNLGVIGVAGRGGDNLNSVTSENIVALCDIDRTHLEPVARLFPAAKAHEDFRRLLDHKDLDAILVSTPDHMHAIPVAAALRLGLDVYCEKPLAHSVHEVRTLRELATKHQCVTQMGTQIHAGDNYRRAVEILKAGLIGAVKRVHVWHNNRPMPGNRAKEGTPPAHINYDLWLGPAPERPFHPSHFHFKWRYWWDFGGGTLGDFGCHYMDLPFWALDLDAPSSVEATGKKDYEGDNEVPGVMRVEYQFPARGEQPPVHLTWYHGGWVPEGAEAYKKDAAVLFEGEKGRLLADYGTHRVFLGDSKAEFVSPKLTIPSSIGHHEEWIQAVKTRGPTTCNFHYSGALAEAVLLGNVSYRAGKKLEWDAKALKALNCPEAAGFVQREYRKGWTL